MRKVWFNCKCLNCGNGFHLMPSKIKRGWGKYCCKKCQIEHRRIIYVGKGNPFYGKHHTKEVKVILSSQKFKRGWSLTEGYIRLYEKGNRGQLLHRKIMEEILGRKLKRSEVVHHINQNRTDNRPKNLQVMSIGEHIKYHKLPNKQGA